jgi:hypothetical protein
MLARILILITCVGFALPAMSQTGHPAKGSWSGNLTSFSSAEPVRIRLLVDAMSGELSGTVNPGRRGVEMTSVELDAENWGLTIEADLPDGALMLEGKLSNIGSWTNRIYRGSYTLGNTKGTFDISLN